MCSRCVLRMDHHCPWVGNCVGMYNHKYFLMFLFHAMMGCAIAAIVMVHNCFYVSIRQFNSNAHYLAVMIVSGALIFSLGGLLGFHSYLLATNNSTLEMANLTEGNPFNRVRRVMKTKAERNARDPLKLVFGSATRPGLGKVKRQKDDDPALRQMKEVTCYELNFMDAMGSDWHYWFLPFAPQGDQPSIDGINWHMKTLN